MWKRKKEEVATPIPPQGSSTAPLGLTGDDALFSQPGSYGAMMLPPKAVKAGFFAGRRRRRAETRSGNSGGGSCGGSNDAAAAAGGGASNQDHQQQHPLCSGDPARIDGLLSDAREAKEAEDALRAEVAKLRVRKAQLDKDIQRLHREKADMTEAHLLQLESLRHDLEANAEEGRRRLQTELENGHARSMDKLRLTLQAETANLERETGRLREDLERARQARAAAAAAAEENGGSKRSGVKAAGGAAGDTPVALSAGFWNSLTNAFTPRDFLDINNGGGGGVEGGGGGGGVPPPALLVLAAVPLFCFYKRWRFQRWGWVLCQGLAAVKI